MLGSITTIPSLRTALLKVASSMSAAIEEKSPLSNLHIDFSKKAARQQQNRLFMSDGLQWMLEGRVSHNLYMIFPFVATFLDMCVEMAERPILTTVHILHSDLLHKIHAGSGELSWTKTELQVCSSKISHFNKLVADTFAKQSSTGLFTLQCTLYTILLRMSVGLARFLFQIPLRLNIIICTLIHHFVEPRET